MSVANKYCAFPGDCTPPNYGVIPADAMEPMVTLSEEKIPHCEYATAEWFTKDCEIPGLRKHESGELHMFLGGNAEDSKPLHGTIEFQVGNDVLTITEACYLYIPAGVAHGNFKITNLDEDYPVIHYLTLAEQSEYSYIPVEEATEEPGTYLHQTTDSFAPPCGKVPGCPPGLLDSVLWMCGDCVEGAPYHEAHWFCYANPDGPGAHYHENVEEIVGFLGCDAKNPRDLGAKLTFFMDGETVVTREPMLCFFPVKIPHGPFTAPEWERRFLHFSGSADPSYEAMNPIPC